MCKQIKNREGELLKDLEEIKKRWKEYIEDTIKMGSLYRRNLI